MVPEIRCFAEVPPNEVVWKECPVGLIFSDNLFFFFTPPVPYTKSYFKNRAGIALPPVREPENNTEQ